MLVDQKEMLTSFSENDQQLKVPFHEMLKKTLNKNKHSKKL